MSNAIGAIISHQNLRDKMLPVVFLYNTTWTAFLYDHVLNLLLIITFLTYQKNINNNRQKYIMSSKQRVHVLEFPPCISGCILRLMLQCTGAVDISRTLYFMGTYSLIHAFINLMMLMHIKVSCVVCFHFFYFSFRY